MGADSYYYGSKLWLLLLGVAVLIRGLWILATTQSDDPASQRVEDARQDELRPLDVGVGLAFALSTCVLVAGIILTVYGGWLGPWLLLAGLAAEGALLVAERWSRFKPR